MLLELLEDSLELEAELVLFWKVLELDAELVLSLIVELELVKPKLLKLSDCVLAELGELSELELLLLVSLLEVVLATELLVLELSLK